MAVHSQWEAEARVRRLFQPYPLPVYRRPARDELVQPWPFLVQLATGTVAAESAPPPPGREGGPQALSGAGTGAALAEPPPRPSARPDAVLQGRPQIHGILRQVGPVYRFRHIDLQRHLASRPSP